MNNRQGPTVSGVPVPNADPASIAIASAREATKFTLAGGLLAGGLIGVLLGIGMALNRQTSSGDKVIGMLIALPGGFIIGALMSLILSLFMALINTIAVAAITRQIHKYNLRVRIYRWVLLLCMPALDIFAMWLIWHRQSTTELGRPILGGSMLIAGVGAIIGSVLLSRWYARTLAAKARYFELIALGYNPEIAAGYMLAGRIETIE